MKEKGPEKEIAIEGLKARLSHLGKLFGVREFTVESPIRWRAERETTRALLQHRSLSNINLIDAVRLVQFAGLYAEAVSRGRTSILPDLQRIFETKFQLPKRYLAKTAEIALSQLAQGKA